MSLSIALVCGQSMIIGTLLLRRRIIMCRKLFFLASFVLVLGMVITSRANAADPNLVGWWKLDEGAGNTAIDSSGNGFDIPLQNHTWGNGVFGR